MLRLKTHLKSSHSDKHWVPLLTDGGTVQRWHLTILTHSLCLFYLLLFCRKEDSSSDTGSLDSDEDSDDSESGTEDEEMNVEEAGSDSESSDNKTDSEVDDDKMNSGSESDSGDELQLLGNIRSSGKTVKEVQQTQNSKNRQQNKADAKQKKVSSVVAIIS